jgi:ATPase subunit of ABC transporter with duplicated ATPase domains
MYKVLVYAAATALMALPTVASAQNFDSCARTGWHLPGVYSPSIAACVQAQAEAADAERDRRMAWDRYYEQQRAAQAARQQAADRAEAAKQEVIAEARQKAALDQIQRDKEARAIAQKEAEDSPDNICRNPNHVKMLLSEFNDFDQVKERGVKAVDMEHITTLKYDTDSQVAICHGSFVMSEGGNETGTMTFRMNAANQPIVTWNFDPFR